MSFGLATWGPDGALQIDPTAFTMRVVLSTPVTFPTNSSSAKASQDFSVPGITPNNGTATVIPIGAYGDATQFETEVLNDVVRVYNWNRGFPAGTWTSTAGTMRLLVIRFA